MALLGAVTKPWNSRKRFLQRSVLAANHGCGRSAPTGPTARARRARWACLVTLLSLAWAVLPLAAQLVPGYRIEDLGELGGGFARARAVNEAGQIVGESLLPIPGTIERGFLWESGLMTDLGTLGGERSRAFDINKGGTICGWAQNASSQTRPVLWIGGSIVELPTLGGPHGVAWGVNDIGAAVGHSYVSSSVYRAARWLEGIVTDLGTLGGTYSVAYDLNSTGLIVGNADDAAGQRACMWTESGPVNLGGLSGGSWTTARAINDQGGIILWGRPAGSTDNRATYWDGDILSPVIDLGTFGGIESWAYGLNNLGHVVGWAELEIGTYHAYVWDGNSKTDLGTLGGHFSSAYGINDRGVIVGFAHDANGNTHAVRWIPVPEPALTGILFAALATLQVLVFWRSRKSV